MKKITRLEVQKKNQERFNVYLNDEYAFGIEMNTLINHSLHVGMEVDDHFIESVLKEEEKNRAFSYALYSLSFRARSEKEIEKKLKEKGYEPKLVSQVIERLKNNGYINDRMFAEMFIKDKTKVSTWGMKRIQHELSMKGITKDIFSEVWETTIDEENETSRVYEIAEKKWNSLHREEKRKRNEKLTAFMLRKGFSYDIVRDIIKKLDT